MDNYIAIVLNDDTKAYQALHELWNLDTDGDITVHGAAVIHRDKSGYVDVRTKDTNPGLRTAIGVGIGALLGALAGPIGAAAGAAAAAAGTGAAIGAASGGVVGLTGDIVKATENDEAGYEAGFVLPPGKSAVIAEVTEQWTTPLDTLARSYDTQVFRKSKSVIRDNAYFGDYPLYPYDYQPAHA
ncbi:MAG: hypothetical protein JO349_08305 [Candidatus Eremiobacteraeota bacterium]|nr:hypothetical protein [Candidatus Eremiobacteraeota bacterium]